MRGYTQVYTGNGKGKTTACIGLAVRAAGADLSVFIRQFLKQGEYSEIKSLKTFKNISVEQYGMGKFVKGKPSASELIAGKKGYSRICKILEKGNHDVVIVEEGNVAVTCNIISEKDLLKLIEIKPEHVELIITGRGASKVLIEKADLVTEMMEIKHYFKKGVTARTGIEK